MAPRREGTYTVCVYGSSSSRTPESYRKASRTLGNLLADRGHVTINGAGKHGCMGALNDGVTERCGRVRGVIHEMWIVDKSEHPGIKDLTVVGGEGLQASGTTSIGAPRPHSCQERKRALTADADCIIALPGGMGTWDELWEAACLKGIGLSTLPICVIDVDGFYAGFKTQLQRACDDLLLYGDPERLVHFETTPEAALNWCEAELKDPNRVQNMVKPVARTTSSMNFQEKTRSCLSPARQSDGEKSGFFGRRSNSTAASIKNLPLVCSVVAVTVVVVATVAVKLGDKSKKS